MLQNYLIKNVQVVNEGRIEARDVLLRDGRIARIAPQIGEPGFAVAEINGEGLHLLPGAIDDQVHFREPGLTHKATIGSEARAAVAGGVTSFMEMPNTQPPVFTQELLEDKYAIAAQSSLANYSFYMGTSNDNVDEVLRTNEKKADVCGVKIFMGASTGNLLVDNYLTIGRIFADSELLIATHCEEEPIIKANYARIKEEKGRLEAADHPLVRDEEACFESSFKAVQLAMKHNSRLHILHITTENELRLFTNMLPLSEKRITSEVCVHHLHFTADDYAKHGHDIKCNPAIKAPHHREALWQALLDDRLDVIATDHAPHLRSEKEGDYEHAHAGLPLVQHPLLLMLHYVKEGRIPLEKVVQKMSHAVADCFQIAGRGYIREGYWADLVLVDLAGKTEVTRDSLHYKCGWSPLEGSIFPARIEATFINGHRAYANGAFDASQQGMRLRFAR
ncbi:dihydroorotase [Flaviaesturariibacter amylovorans]|uniref:Dihydroorotase n=1 Tax=Flaviaesturariibacter amylovorans TaxID=1084520 RepID=A0ABP8H489_9BACT